MTTLMERVHALEQQARRMDERVADPVLDGVAEFRQDAVGLREDMLALYRFVEENVGVRDCALERRLKGGNRNGAADHPIKT